jgi:hypothetical protein
MTLIVRLIFKDRTYIASDNKQSDQDGLSLNKGICKLIECPKIKSVIGLSGFLWDKDFNFIKHLSGVTEAEDYTNLNELIQQINTSLKEISSEYFEKSISVIIPCSMNFDYHRTAFIKEAHSFTFKEIKKNHGHEFYNNYLKNIRAQFSIDLNLIEENIEISKLIDSIDFDKSFIPQDLLEVGSFQPHSVFYSLFYAAASEILKHEGVIDFEILTDLEIVEIFKFFYKIIDKYSDHNSLTEADPSIRSNSYFITIGTCNSIVKTDNLGTMWLLRI